uniref:Uncharacterized protein n=1 Tax=Neisseria meningitidis alpha275 TaxID=295996 RepID=C6SK47_NEIME|nr:hypothetical protein predicted by Glimmer/Critica [Neisseria meningitidis alpha275]
MQAKKKQMPVDIYPMFHSREQFGFPSDRVSVNTLMC